MLLVCLQPLRTESVSVETSAAVSPARSLAVCYGGCDVVVHV